MKKILLMISMILASLSAQAADWPNALSAQDAKRMLDAGSAILIDIREHGEIVEGMAAPALWYAKSSIDTNENAFIAFLQEHQDKEVILYCRSGRRASVIIERLKERGIFAHNMGGYQDWRSAGYPTKIP